MQKDVLYIDVEDDITAIIGKVKASKGHVVALVPPKRAGAIQSAVNLKLVHRAAEQADKRLVIITNNSALMALASSAGIPTAKNLQSRPEMAEVPALDVDDGEDVIDGGELPVGEHAKAVEAATDDAAAPAVGAAAVAGAARTGTGKDSPAKSAGKAAAISPLAAAKAKGAAMKGKVPNFNTFRKKFFLIAAGALLLIGFLIWAIFFAPSARIVISARTSDSPLNSKVTLDPNAPTDLKSGTIKAEVKTAKKDVSIPFTATGKKDVGEKASGTVKFTNTNPSPANLAAGTQLTASGGLVFVLPSNVTVPGAQLSFSCPGYLCPGSTNGGVTAAESGTKYNSASGSLGGTPAGVSASFTSPTGGGTDKTVSVVEQGDVDAVAGDVSKPSDADAAKKDLAGQFGKDYVILDNTFKADTSGVRPSPGVGQEAGDGKGTLAGSVTYSLTAVPKKEISAYLDQYFAQQIDGKPDQKVYGNGLDEVAFSNVNETDGKFTATITTNGKIGPRVNEQAIKEYARGKKYGDIKAKIEAIGGVEEVDVKFSPFWVTTAPNDVKRISFQFNNKVENGK